MDSPNELKTKMLPAYIEQIVDGLLKGFAILRR
jgi:hypothetical protein